MTEHVSLATHSFSRRAFVGAAAALGISVCLPAITPATAHAVTAAEKQAEANAALEKLSALQDQLNAASDTYYDALSDQEAAQGRMDEAQTRIDEASGRIGELQEHLGTRARSMYRSGSTTFIDLLLGATSFQAFASNWDLLNEMNQPFTAYALDGAAMERWDKVIKLRDVVNQALETARNKKEIGKSLEAKIVLTVPAFETALDGMDADTLADILIVSQAEVQKSDMNVLKVDVEPAAGQKCERCWKVLPTVGASAKHPTLCPRCARVVQAMPAIEIE